MPLARTTLALALVTTVTVNLSAQTAWPQFRGLHGGVAENDPALPETGGPDDNIVCE